MSAEQGRWLTEYFSPWLLRLGYETQESLRAALAVPLRSDRIATAPNFTGNFGVPATNQNGVFMMSSGRTGN